MAPFPSMKAKQLLAVLMREPLGYRVVRQKGSHRILAAPGRKRVIYAFYERQEIPPGVVRDVLVKQVGLEEQDALDLL